MRCERSRNRAARTGCATRCCAATRATHLVAIGTFAITIHVPNRRPVPAPIKTALYFSAFSAFQAPVTAVRVRGTPGTPRVRALRERFRHRLLQPDRSATDVLVLANFQLENHARAGDGSAPRNSGNRDRTSRSRRSHCAARARRRRPGATAKRIVLSLLTREAGRRSRASALGFAKRNSRRN